MFRNTLTLILFIMPIIGFGQALNSFKSSDVIINHLLEKTIPFIKEKRSAKPNFNLYLNKKESSINWNDKVYIKWGISESEIQQYTGWWVYGEGQHIFKDDKTLNEWDLIFPNENKEELVDLYLAICEMEYFPMEVMINGQLHNDTLIVDNFEILYIQGCGE